MTFQMYVGLFIAVIVGMVGGYIVYKKRPRKLKTQTYVTRWKDLQAKLRDPTAWAVALLEADKMLDMALKKRKFNGKSMGERLVSAQRLFADNDDIWFAHNLAKKVASNEEFKLKESDVKAALLGFRNALKDIGALQFAVKENESSVLDKKS